MENHKNKISIWIAILININVIVGSAFFLGTANVSQKSGMLAPVTWIVWGLIILPIVLVFAKLSKIYPFAGGVYIYPQKELNSFWGFVSGWGYFIGSIAGNAAIIHSFGILIQQLGFQNTLQQISLVGLPLDIFFITFFTLLNLLNINFLEKTHVGFAALKTIPLFFVVISALFLFNPTNITTAPINFSGFFDSIPFVLFAYIGFEVCCSIAHQIKDGEKNASKAILLSFGMIMLIYTILQLCLLGINGVGTINPFMEIFPKLTSNPMIIEWGNKILQLAIISSYLGGYYGMFYTNNWILYAIAQQNSLPYSNKLTMLNKFHMPSTIILFQGTLTILFLIITQNKEYLVAMSDFAVITAYLLSTIAFIAIMIKQKRIKNLGLGLLATLSCIYLLYFCMHDVFESGFLIPFSLILGIGIALNFIKGNIR
jgi:basic amino acid/polyamine antiporter, APA family